MDDKCTLLAGDPPSKEAFLHRAMYDARSQAGAIVHLHSTHSAAVSCMSGLDHHSCIPPLTPYFVMKIGQLPLVPYYRPGDHELVGAIHGDRKSTVMGKRVQERVDTGGGRHIKK